VHGDVRITSYVPSFRSLGTRWNIDVKAPCEIAHASNVGATRSLRGQDAEVAFRDESREVFEGVGQGHCLLVVRRTERLFRVIVTCMTSWFYAAGRAFTASRRVFEALST